MRAGRNRILTFFRGGLSIAAFATAFLWIESPLYSDTIFLRNERVIEGKIINQNRTEVTIETLDGKKTFLKEKILRISFKQYNLKEEAAKRKAEEERKEAEEEERRKAQETRRLEMERASALMERRASLPGEELTWLRMHLDLRRPEKHEESVETDVLEDPSVLTGDAGRSRLPALWRSALLPGWGQYHLGNKWKGALYASGFLFTAALAAGYYSSADRYATSRKNLQMEKDLLILYGVTQYKMPGAIAAELYYGTQINLKTDRANGRSRIYNVFFAAGVLLYGVNIVDAAWNLPDIGTAGVAIRTDGVSGGEFALQVRF